MTLWAAQFEDLPDRRGAQPIGVREKQRVSHAAGSAAVERVANATEKAWRVDLEHTIGELFAAQTRELAQQFFLLAVELGRRCHLEMHKQIAAAVRAKP